MAEQTMLPAQPPHCVSFTSTKTASRAGALAAASKHFAGESVTMQRSASLDRRVAVSAVELGVFCNAVLGVIDAAVGGEDVNAPDVEAAHPRRVAGAILQGGDGFVDLVVESGLLAFLEAVTDEDDVEFRGRAAIDQNAGVGQAGRLHLHGHLGAGDERREGDEDERKKDPCVHGACYFSSLISPTGLRSLSRSGVEQVHLRRDFVKLHGRAARHDRDFECEDNRVARVWRLSAKDRLSRVRPIEQFHPRLRGMVDRAGENQTALGIDQVIGKLRLLAASYHVRFVGRGMHRHQLESAVLQLQYQFLCARRQHCERRRLADLPANHLHPRFARGDVRDEHIDFCGADRFHNRRGLASDLDARSRDIGECRLRSRHPHHHPRACAFGRKRERRCAAALRLGFGLTADKERGKEKKHNRNPEISLHGVSWLILLPAEPPLRLGASHLNMPEYNSQDVFPHSGALRLLVLASLIMESSSQSAATTRVDRFFRHPLTLSIVGALLGSLLIPWVAGRANKQAVLAETRVKQAIEMMATSNSVNVMLNKLKTEFESFEKDSLSTASPEEYLKRRDELRQRVYALYADFNSTGWWWTWNAYNQARILRLIGPKALEQMKADIMKYDSNLQQTVHLLDEPWHMYLSEDPHVLLPAAERKPVMPAVDKPFGALRQQRDTIVQDMASLFQ